MFSRKIIALCAAGLLAITAIPVVSNAAARQASNQKQAKKQLQASKQTTQSRTHRTLHSIKPSARHTLARHTTARHTTAKQSHKQLRTHSAKAHKLSTKTRTISKSTHKNLSSSRKQPAKLSTARHSRAM